MITAGSLMLTEVENIGSMLAIFPIDEVGRGKKTRTTDVSDDQVRACFQCRWGDPIPRTSARKY